MAVKGAILNVRPEDRDLVKEVAEKRGTSMASVIEEIFQVYRSHLAASQDSTGQDALEKDYIRRDDLEAQARNIVQSMFQPIDADYFFELCDLQYKIPAHFLLAGILKIAREQGQWTAFILDPAWQSGGVWQREAVCKYCGQKFTPKRIGQIYCSNECAAKDAQSTIQKEASNG